MLISPTALAAPVSHAGGIIDVALGEGGVLVGQVVDAQGAAIRGLPVSIRSGGREVLQATTDANGHFAAPGLKGGVYEVAAAEHHGLYRLWAPKTAPPAANRGIMAVIGDAVRAQYAPPPAPEMISAPPGPMGPGYIETIPYTPSQPGPFKKSASWVKNHPWITAGFVATAIAVPLAVSEYDDDPAS
jgi:hypothetical protein